MRKIVFLFLILFGSYAFAYPAPNDQEGCSGPLGATTNIQQVLAQYQDQSPSVGFTIGYTGPIVQENNVEFGFTYSQTQFFRIYRDGVNYASHTCYSDPPPPVNCADRQGDFFFVTTSKPYHEGESSDGCYYSCVWEYEFGGPNHTYECTYDGSFAQDTTDPADPSPFSNVDTTDSSYCDVQNSDGSCIDYDHDDNLGGCGAHGRVYGTATLPDGTTATGCFQSSSDPDSTVDTDNDGIPDVDDPDIDNDGIPNAQDDDVDGDGTPNAQDGTPNGSGNGSSGSGNGGYTGEEEGSGTATNCDSPPTSSGDAQLAAIHLQLWKNECEGKGEFGETSGYYEGDGDGNGKTFASVMGEFKDGVSTAPIVAAYDSFFNIALGGSCPVYSATVGPFVVTLNQWCDPNVPWTWISGVLLAVSTLLAIRIAAT